MIKWHYLDTFHAHILRLFWQTPFQSYSFHRSYSMCCRNHVHLCCNLPHSSYFVSKGGYMTGFLIPFPPWMQLSSNLKNGIMIITISNFIDYSRSKICYEFALIFYKYSNAYQSNHNFVSCKHLQKIWFATVFGYQIPPKIYHQKTCKWMGYLANNHNVKRIPLLYYVSEGKLWDFLWFEWVY